VVRCGNAEDVRRTRKSHLHTADPTDVNVKTWNVFHITVKDNKLTVNLNGELVNELDMTQGKAASRPQTGWIGFQDHGLPLWLRNIKIREL
jgi:hypothetical protein